jgi:hypothetical protein
VKSRVLAVASAAVLSLTACSDPPPVTPVPSTTEGIWSALGQSNRMLQSGLVKGRAQSKTDSACALLRGADQAISQADPGKVPSLVGGVSDAVARAAGVCGDRPRASYCLMLAVLSYSPYHKGGGRGPSLIGWPRCDPDSRK